MISDTHFEYLCASVSLENRIVLHICMIVGFSKNIAFFFLFKMLSFWQEWI